MKFKKEKFLTLLVSLGLIITGPITVMEHQKIEEYIKSNTYTKELYESVLKRKVRRSLDRMISRDSFCEVLDRLPIEKMELAQEIFENKDLVDFINSGKTFREIGEGSFETYDSARRLLRISKGLQELEMLSPSVKEYLETIYPDADYRNSISKNDRAPEIIKIRERIIKLLNNDTLKAIVEGLPPNKIDAMNKILISNPDILTLLEKKDISDFSTERVFSVARSVYSMSSLDPTMAVALNNILPEFDYRKAALYGSLYLSDARLEREYEKQYSKGTYSLKHPYVLLNPYGRTPLTAMVRFNISEHIKHPKIRVTVLGENYMPSYTYYVNYIKNSPVPIVGLYPNKNNRVILSLMNNGRTVETTEIKITTGGLDDRLPSINIEKRRVDSIEPGMNLANYNLRDEGMPFVFDSGGNIRYVLTTGPAFRKVSIKRGEDNNWVVSNDEDNFTVDMFGKILGRIGRVEPITPVKNRRSQYLVRNNNILTITGFQANPYATALYSEVGLDTKDELYRAVLYYDKSSQEENRVDSGERIHLYPLNEK
ncbi:MAG: aryl-sulfate sulfotransferase N-terminal domain-containing protein [Cetobacterium sp.]|uniref:aryl-sulfate sulfotransferase N-terminal domain-containing protein n=1 Tax=unclassified Cetobacterium TaxID=2630983 RepID=UPI00163D3736|nr:aryl-sulfate sulfotransferase N-terminal domain-containing protein [Cetobacterium sp. 2A]MBC2856147.1 arylsulfate sulfotransferase N-terminal domain-containing protein [Cetobacterium sp. 2A]